MMVIPLQAIPNQSFSIQLDNNNFDISLRACDNTPTNPGTRFMTFSLAINEVVILTNERMVPAWPLIAYSYLENGNFVMVTENDEYPYYTEFGVTQYLIYVSQTELAQIQAGTFVNVGT